MFILSQYEILRDLKMEHEVQLIITVGRNFMDHQPSSVQVYEYILVILYRKLTTLEDEVRVVGNNVKSLEISEKEVSFSQYNNHSYVTGICLVRL